MLSFEFKLILFDRNFAHFNVTFATICFDGERFGACCA